MPIEIPHEVVVFLNFVGVPYPDINEDDVRSLGEHVRCFAANVQDTHESATGVIKDMGSIYSGYSYEELVATWARMSATNMTELDEGCKVVARALDIAADVITAVKVAVLAELAALAVSYAAILATPAGPAAGPAIATAARRICDQMQQNLVGYLLAEVIGKAIEPFEDAIEKMIHGFVYGAASNALGVPPSDSSSALPLYIEPDEVMRYARILDDHADEMMRHAENFATNVGKLDFTTRSLDSLSAQETGRAPIDLIRSANDSQVQSAPHSRLELPPTSREFPHVHSGASFFDPPSPHAGGHTTDVPADHFGRNVATAEFGGRHSAGMEAKIYAPMSDSPARQEAHAREMTPVADGISSTNTPDRAARGGVGHEVDNLPAHPSNIAASHVPPLSDDVQTHRTALDTAVAETRLHGRSSMDIDSHKSESAAEPYTVGARAQSNYADTTDQTRPQAQRAIGPSDQSTKATPWSRSARAATQRKSASKFGPSEASRTPGTSSPAQRPMATPWSRTERTPSTPKVFAPSATGPRRRQHVTDRGSVNPETRSPTVESDADTQPPARPVVYSRETERHDQPPANS
ncbi:WXG100-like domain-containing protein [Nocardia amamiensis]|uniref:WXG100-like domain-containing protein n=1 Tax=Nocardia amamiensis TaxID=404578 RepID=UPI000A6B1881|nr:hypothetical protein [Nocardia amamiensis]